MYIYIIKQVLYEFSIKPFSDRGFHVNIPNYIKNQDIQSWKLGIRSCFVLQNDTRTFVYIVINILQHITQENLGKMLITRDGQEFELKAQGWNPLKD